MKRLWWIFILVLSILPALLHLHLLEKDFLEILGGADGFYTQRGYCFLEIRNYAGNTTISGLQGRPPLIQMLLAGSFHIFGRSLLAIYTVYLIPRLVILPALYLLARQFFERRQSYLISFLPLIFPFFETYAVSTLKADVFVVAWSIAALVFHFKWKKSHTRINLFLSSFFLTLNVYSKETALTFSLIMWAFQLVYLIKQRKLRHFLPAISIPPLMFLTPFVIFSLNTTGRLFPSIFATAQDLSSFPLNIKTYLLSVLYYSGIRFDLSRLISLVSLMRLLLVLGGIYTIVKKRLFELILPLLGVLVSISIINYKVVQGDSVGNREILHRIALSVPFVALYLGFGIRYFVELLSTEKRRLVWSNLTTVFLLIITLNFYLGYFSAPYALDYTDKEFYVDAPTIITRQLPLPVTQFRSNNDPCIINYVPGGEFIINNYRQYKKSAFPHGYKELILGFIIVPYLLETVITYGHLLKSRVFK